LVSAWEAETRRCDIKELWFGLQAEKTPELKDNEAKKLEMHAKTKRREGTRNVGN